MALRKTTRGRRSRGRFGFLYVVLSFLIILAALVAGSVVFFRANTITVEGNDRYTAEEIVAAAQVMPEENLFRISRPRTCQKILDALPYVRSVSIRRALPDELVISVTETRAVACLSCAEGVFLVDSRGKVVEQVSAPPASLPPILGLTPLPPAVGSLLTAEEGSQTRLEGLAGVLTALEERGLLKDLIHLDLSSTSEVVFGYTDRFTVKIPTQCDFDYKLRSLEFVMQQLEDNETGLIDLTRDAEVHFIPQ